MPQRSASSFQNVKKLNTNRSQRMPQTSRNSQSNSFNSSILKNMSQVVSKHQKKRDDVNEFERKKSLSSYYFKNCKKNSRQVEQSFGKFLKSKNQNQNCNRKRCVTSANVATNKIVQPIETFPLQSKVIQILPLQFATRKHLIFCKNHPQKPGYFEQKDSFDCYCHQCSIGYVNENRRLIEVTPEVLQVKRLVEQKIRDTMAFGDQLCQMIREKVQESVKSLQRQYDELKMRITAQMHVKSKGKECIEFTIKEIDWGFIEKKFRMLECSNLKELSFLDLKDRKYRLHKMSRIEQENQSISDEYGSANSFSPVKKFSLNQKELLGIQSIKKVSLPSQRNLINPPSQQNLIGQKQKVLNYQSRNSILKIKTVDLSSHKIKDSSRSKNKQNSIQQDKENMQPNIELDCSSIKTDLSQIKGDMSSVKKRKIQVKRVCFGNLV